MKSLLRPLLGLLGFALILLPLAIPEAAAAHSIHKEPIAKNYNNRIIDDPVFTQENTMSINSIQSFLNAKVPVCESGFTCLKDYSQGGKMAARIIYEAAQDFDINPRVILVTLQKEQSLITDDQPGNTQYQTAMGYGCPEGEDCNSDYFGLTNQVRLGTKLLRVGHDRFCGNNTSYPGWGLNSAWYTNDADKANPWRIDGRNTDINTCGTAALYNYTPHRPDSAYRTAGDGSHYYGNYNFIDFFKSWFGSTYSDFRLMKAGTSEIFLVEKGTKRRILGTESGNTDALEAWGFDNLFVETVGSMSGYKTVRPYLGRFASDAGSGIKYFADGQKYHRLASTSMINTWNFENQAFAPVSRGVITWLDSGGNMSSVLKAPSVNGTIYLMNDGILRAFTLDAYMAWTGGKVEVTAVSGDYFCTSGDGGSCVRRFSSGANLTHPRIVKTGTSQEYFINNGQRYALSAAIEPLFPLSPQSISLVAIDTFKNNGYVLPTIKEEGSGTIYLMDGAARPIAGFGYFKTWAPNSILSASYFNPTAFSFLGSGSSINSNFCTNNGTTHVIDGGTKRTFVNATTRNLWVGSNTPVACGNALANYYDTQAAATRVIKGSSATIYAMENGQKHPIQGLQNYRDNYQQYGLTRISDYLLANIPTGSVISQ